MRNHEQLEEEEAAWMEEELEREHERMEWYASQY